MKKKREPEYFLSRTNIRTLNYNEYYMKPILKLCYIVGAFIIGAALGYLFYGGLGTDAHKNATITTYICDFSISSLVGVVAVLILVPVRKKQLMEKRKTVLREQFIDMLEALATSISAGKNVSQAFEAIRSDLAIQYEEDAFIIKEVDLIINEMNNGVAIEDLIADFGKRSGIHDISNFGQVFEVSYRKGGNLKEIIKNSHEIISEKIGIELEIKTKVASAKSQISIMCIMPILMMLMMKLSGGDFADKFATTSGVVSTTVSIIIFVVAFFIGQKILSIDI